jgi:hypothetical protein
VWSMCLTLLAAGVSEDQILKDYPTLSPRRSGRPPAPECTSPTLVQRPAGLLRPCLTSRPTFCHSAPMETHAFGFRLRANASAGQKRSPISQLHAIDQNDIDRSSLQRPRSMPATKFIALYFESLLCRL